MAIKPINKSIKLIDDIVLRGLQRGEGPTASKAFNTALLVLERSPCQMIAEQKGRSRWVQKIAN